MTENERCKLALAKTIFKFRRLKNIKRLYLAAHLGVTDSAIDKMEQAVTHPKFGQVFSLCKVLGISMQEFAIAFESELDKIPPPRNLPKALQQKKAIETK